MKPAKTNAMRLLEGLGFSYTPHTYDTADGAIDGVSVAAKTQRDANTVYKTLVTRGASGAVLVFCLPVGGELHLKAAARAAGEKSIAMLPLQNITAITGYVRGGVSPLAMKKSYPTFIDEAAQQQGTILVSGGKIGLQIELAPQDLATAVQAAWFRNAD